MPETTYWVDIRFAGERNHRASVPCDSSGQADEVRAALDEIDWLMPAVIAADHRDDDPLPKLTASQLTRIITAVVRGEYKFLGSEEYAS